MSQSARVTSIDAIKEYRAALCRFGEDTKNALAAVDMEIHRTTDWLLHDRPMYWQMEIKRRKEDLSEAQAALFRKRLQAGIDRQVHDSEQKEAVRISQRRLREAEERLETVKKWAPMFQHAVFEYLARARPTGDMCESDLKLALALLDRMTGALDAYVATAPPTTSNMEAVTSASLGTAANEAVLPAPKPPAPPTQESEGGLAQPAAPSEAQQTSLADKSPLLEPSFRHPSE